MQVHLPQIRPENRFRNLGLLLVFVVLLQFGYPITLRGELATGLYMLLYAGMIFYGTLTVREEASASGSFSDPQTPDESPAWQQLV